MLGARIRLSANEENKTVNKINLVNRPTRAANHVNAWGLIVGSYVLKVGGRWIASAATILEPGLTDKPNPAKDKSASKGEHVRL